MAAKELIQTITVGSGGAAAIEFTSIPQDGTDLFVVLSARGDTNNDLKMEFNGVTTGYTRRALYGNAGSALSFSASNAFPGVINTSTNTANTFGNTALYVPNYTLSNNKSISSDSLYENNDSSTYLLGLYAMLWSNTAAVTSIKISTGGNLVQHSTASLYKFTKGSGGATVA